MWVVPEFNPLVKSLFNRYHVYICDKVAHKILISKLKNPILLSIHNYACTWHLTSHICHLGSCLRTKNTYLYSHDSYTLIRSLHKYGDLNLGNAIPESPNPILSNAVWKQNWVHYFSNNPLGASPQSPDSSILLSKKFFSPAFIYDFPALSMPSNST